MAIDSFHPMGVMRYIINASNSDGSKTKTRTVNGLRDVPRWVDNTEDWPNVSIVTPGGKIKYQRVNGVVVVDNTRKNLSLE